MAASASSSASASASASATTTTARLSYAAVVSGAVGLGAKPALVATASERTVPEPTAPTEVEPTAETVITPEEAALARLDAIAATLVEGSLMAELAASKLFRRLVKAYALVLSYRARGAVAAALREADREVEAARRAMTCASMARKAVFQIVSRKTGKLIGVLLPVPAVAFLKDGVFPHRTSFSSSSPMENDTAAFIRLFARLFPEAFPEDTPISICVGDDRCDQQVELGYVRKGHPVKVFSVNSDGDVHFGNPNVIVTFVWEDVPDYF